MMAAPSKSLTARDKEGFMCDVCDRDCRTVKAYLAHVRSHSEDELEAIWFQCNVCNDYFPTDFDRQAHGLLEHPTRVRFIRCRFGFCLFKSGKNNDFFAHCQTVHNDETRKLWLPCGLCSESRPSRISWRVHRVKHSKPAAPVTSSVQGNNDSVDTSEGAVKFVDVNSLLRPSSSLDEPPKKKQKVRLKLSINQDDPLTNVEPEPEGKTEFLPLALPPPPPLPEKLHVLKCGLCNGVQKGDLKSHFGHAKTCLLQKNLSIQCPSCPEMSFPDKSAFQAHMRTMHELNHCKMRCIWCGDVQETNEEWCLHSVRCCGKMSMANYRKCDHCSTAFFFDDTIGNVYFVAHMNNEHPEEAVEKWNLNTCTGCRIYLPDASTASQHSKVCAFKNPSVVIDLDDEPASDAVPINFRCGLCMKEVKCLGENEFFSHFKSCYAGIKGFGLCLHCPHRVFTRFLEYMVHMLNSHQVKAKGFTCVFCGAVMERRAHLRNHQLVHRCAPDIGIDFRRECPICPAQFYFDGATDDNPIYVGHLNSVHADRVRSHWPNFSCDKCSFRFPTARSRDLHSKICMSLVSELDQAPAVKEMHTVTTITNGIVAQARAALAASFQAIPTTKTRIKKREK